MADANVASLCGQIVHSHFGPLAFRVADTLLTRGRLGLGQIIRFTQLRPRTARASILVLVQHNVLWHATIPDEGEVLEFNVEECLTRLRYGRYVHTAQTLFGDAAAEIVQLILDHGKLPPPAIYSSLVLQDAKVYQQMLLKLVTGRYLKASILLSHQSPRDKLLKYDAEERKKISGFPTSRQLVEAKESAVARLRREEREAEKVGIIHKMAEDPKSKSTKRKLVETEVVDDEVYFRVNCERFNIHIRNQLIVDAARDRYNEAAASVMKATLKVTETKQFSLSEVMSDPTSVAEIALHLPDTSPGLAAGLVSSSSKATTMSLVRDYLGLLSAADNPTPAGRAGTFLSFGGSKAQVEFELLARALQLRVMDGIARERHGDAGVRIMRLLRGLGKTAEQQIGKVGMMASKEVRPLLSAMAADGLVSMQEVPKSADRNPSRTFYLWYIDPKKSAAVVLGQLYKMLYNIGKRRAAEGDDPLVKAVIEKRARSDVEQDEGLLTRNERELIQDWEGRCERLTVVEMRVEEAVFVLRDMAALISHEK